MNPSENGSARGIDCACLHFLFLPVTSHKKCVGKSESTGRGPCGHSAESEERCFQAAKALQSRRRRMRDMRREHAFTVDFTEVSRFRVPRRRKKTLRKGKRRLEAGVQPGGGRSWRAGPGRESPLQLAGDRDKASAECRVRCSFSPALHITAAPATLLTIRRPDIVLSLSLVLCHCFTWL